MKRSTRIGTALALFVVAFSLTWWHAFRNEAGIMDYTGSLYRSYRIYRGQWPYRDFYCPVTPGTFFTQAALWRIGGLSLNWTRGYMGFCTGFLAVVCFLFAEGAGLGLFESFLLYAVFVAWSPFCMLAIPWYDSDSYAWALLTGLSLFGALAREGAFWQFLLAGCFAAISILYKQNLGVACVILGLGMVAFMPGVQARGKKILAYLGGTLLVLLPFFLWLWHDGILPHFYEWVYIRAKEGKVTSGWWVFLSWPLRLLRGSINHFMRVWFLLYATAGGLLAYRSMRSSDPAARRRLVLWGFFLSYSFGVTYAGLTSNAGGQFHFQMIFLWLPLLIMMRFSSFKGQRWISGLVVLLLIAESLRISFFIHWVDPHMPATPYAVQTPLLRGVYFTESDGRNVDAVVTALTPRLATGDNVWIYPEPVIAYLALDRLAPTPQTEYFWRPTMRPEDQSTIIESLRGKKVRWAVLWLSTTYCIGLRLFPLLNDYMATHFEIVDQEPGYVLLHRPDDNYIAPRRSRAAVLELIRRHVE